MESHKTAMGDIAVRIGRIWYPNLLVLPAMPRRLPPGIRGRMQMSSFSSTMVPGIHGPIVNSTLVYLSAVRRGQRCALRGLPCITEQSERSRKKRATLLLCFALALRVAPRLNERAHTQRRTQHATSSGLRSLRGLYTTVVVYLRAPENPSTKWTVRGVTTEHLYYH